MFRFPLIAMLALMLFAQNAMALSFGSNPDNRKFLENEKNTINIFQQAVKSVVNVRNYKTISRRGFFRVHSQEVPAGQGSGFVWDNNGHIVTNYHVVQGGSKFQITFHADKKQYDAKIVATEPTKDIAVLKIIDPPKNITPISVSESSKLIVGQKALAIGHPFELDHTLTTGIVSALGRKIRGISNIDIHDMIQTDCSINPGNSGGPLLDSSGKLIGMNTMIYSQSGSSAGVGFAVPSDTISRIVPQLIKHKKVIRPTLGIQTLSSWQQERFGIEKGVVVKSIADNSPAEEAGIRGLSEDKRGYLYLGDVIESVDGKEVNNFSDIYNAMDKYKFGDTLKLEIRRNDKLINLKVRLKKYSD